MGQSLLTRAAQGEQEAFRELTDPYRRELQFHCYRILGSMQDAEDALQETLLSAWRGLSGYEGTASLRAWLYRIATNRCLDALRALGRRSPPAPEPPSAPPEPTRRGEVSWLQPYPDALLEGIIDTAPGPDARYQTRETVELAFVAALQHLPPRQRAVLLLRDVLGFHAAEVADTLETSEDSVKSALRRARVTIERLFPASDRGRAPEPNSPTEHDLVRRFADAWMADDIDRVVALLTEDAWFTMPPPPHEYQGRAAIFEYLQLAGWAPPQPDPNPSQRPTSVWLLSHRLANTDRARRRSARADSRGRPHFRDYPLCRQQRSRPLRAASTLRS